MGDFPGRVTAGSSAIKAADQRNSMGTRGGQTNSGGEVPASPKDPPEGDKKTPNPLRAPQANPAKRGHPPQRKGSTEQKSVTPPGTLVQPGNNNKAAGNGGGWHSGAGGPTDPTFGGHSGQGGWSPAPNREQGAGWLPFGAGGNHNLGGPAGIRCEGVPRIRAAPATGRVPAKAGAIRAALALLKAAPKRAADSGLPAMGV